MTYVILVCRRFFTALFVLLLLAGMAAADPPAADKDQPAADKDQFTQLGRRAIISNPQANPSLNGVGDVGLLFGLDKETIRLGGIFLPQLNRTASGGVNSHTWFGGLLVGANAGVNLQRTLGIPGATFGVEFIELTGGATNAAAGSVQQYDGLTGAPPRARQELLQLWWHQRLFDDKLLFQIGKMNAGGQFGAVLSPVIISDPKLQDSDISVLVWAPSGINPTMFGKLPIYPNTAYGAVVHFAPIKTFYASYGIFDGNGALGKQTGVMLEPRITPYKFHVGELGGTWLLGAKQLPGRFGIGGWAQTGYLFTPYLTNQHGALGYYLFANQRLWYRNPYRDNSGLISYLQFGHTSDHAAQVNNYVGAGLTAVGLLPVLPYNRISLGVAWSDLNDAPIAGAFFYPGVPSHSTKMRASELMLQFALQSTFYPPPLKSSWPPPPGITVNVAYTYIPSPGERLDLPQAHTVILRMVQLF